LCNAECAEVMTMDSVGYAAWLNRRTQEQTAQVRGARVWSLRTHVAVTKSQEEAPMTSTARQQEALRTVEDELAQPGGNILVQMALGQLRTAAIEAESERTALTFQIACAPSMSEHFTRADLEALDLVTLSRLAEAAKPEFDWLVAAQQSGVPFVPAPDGYAIALAQQKLRDLRSAGR